MVADEVVLEAQGLAKRLGRRGVLTDANIAVQRGEVVGICGENGSGKTTLLRILAGFLPSDRGWVHRYAGLGYAPQQPLLYDQLSVWEHFRYVAAARRMPDTGWRERAHALLERYRFVQWKETRVAGLSGGTQQKLNLALALLADPAVLLLDEPYGGFEWETYLHFWTHVGELREAGRSAVIVSHLFYDRSRLDRTLVLSDGQLGEVR